MNQFRATIFTTLAAMIFLFLLSLLFSNITSTIQLTNRMPSQQSSISGSERLKGVLRGATMPTRTVILTIVEKSWARTGSILDLFIESFEIGKNTKQLLNHLVIVCLDSESLHYCKTIHPHCFYFQPKTKLHDAKGSLNIPAIDHLRNQILLDALHFGYNVVYTEADVMWLRNPFPLFNHKAEVTIGCEEIYSGKKTSGGFFYLKSHIVTVEFLVLWNLINVVYPNIYNKSVCAMAAYEDFKRIGASIHYIDTKYYGGFCERNKDISNIYTMHANCCDDLEKKIYDMKIFLDDFRYKQLMGKGISLESLSAAAGNSPMKCF